MFEFHSSWLPDGSNWLVKSFKEPSCQTFSFFCGNLAFVEMYRHFLIWFARNQKSCFSLSHTHTRTRTHMHTHGLRQRRRHVFSVFSLNHIVWRSGSKTMKMKMKMCRAYKWADPPTSETFQTEVQNRDEQQISISQMFRAASEQDVQIERSSIRIHIYRFRDQ